MIPCHYERAILNKCCYYSSIRNYVTRIRKKIDPYHAIHCKPVLTVFFPMYFCTIKNCPYLSSFFFSLHRYFLNAPTLTKISSVFLRRKKERGFHLSTLFHNVFSQCPLLGRVVGQPPFRFHNVVVYSLRFKI